MYDIISKKFLILQKIEANMAVYMCKECQNAFLAKKKAKYCSASCRCKAYYRDNTEKCKNLTANWERANPGKVKLRKNRYFARKRRESEK